MARPHIAVLLLQLIETYRREPRLEGPSFVICSSGMPSDRSGLVVVVVVEMLNTTMFSMPSSSNVEKQNGFQ